MAVAVNELVTAWKEMAVAYSEVLFRQNVGSKEATIKSARIVGLRGAISYTPQTA
jgi:hypothetical protein